MDIKRRVLQLLGKAGMTSSEAKFYLTAHKNPKLTIKELQIRSGLSRTSAYRVFENLKNMGLITSSQDNWRKSIETVSLRTVAEKLAKEQRRLRKVELELKSMSDLMGLTAFSHIQDPVDVISDKNKIVDEAFKLLSADWDHMLCFGSAERLLEVIGDSEEKSWVQSRFKKGKTVDVWLTELGKYSDYFLPSSGRELRNVKINLDNKNKDYCTYVCGDKVAIWQKDDEFGNKAVIIKDPTIVKSYEQMFQSLWTSK